MLRRLFRLTLNRLYGRIVKTDPVFNVGDLVSVKTRKFFSPSTVDTITSTGIVVRVVRGTDTIYEWMGDKWVYEVFVEGGKVVLRGEHGMKKL